MKITQEVTAWMTGSCGFTLEDFKNPLTLDLSRFQHLPNDHPNMSDVGWTYIGPAVITLEIPSLDTVINAKADSLRAEITKAKADAARTIAILEDRLSKLSALPMSAEAEQ